MRMMIEKAQRFEAERILALQRLAYQSEAIIYADDTIEPLTQSVEHLIRQFEDHVVLKATHEGSLVGSVRAIAAGGTCYIGKLIVHPDYQGKGIGKSLMAAIENEFPDHRYELFTGSQSVKNIGLYTSLGYRIFKSEQINEHIGLVFLEKQWKRQTHVRLYKLMSIFLTFCSVYYIYYSIGQRLLLSCIWIRVE